MEAKSTRKRWTYSEFARLPESGSKRYEIINDELVVTPAPTSRHQLLVAELLYRLVGFAKRHDLGTVFPAPLDVLFGEGDYLEPDIVFVRRERAHLLSDRGVEGPPDLVIEVTSPSTAGRDHGVKLDRYRLYGVPEYWVVDPDERTVEVWRLARGASEPARYAGTQKLTWTPSPDGPMLEIPLAELFAS